jgi:SAM-dependent methyltransferase
MEEQSMSAQTIDPAARVAADSGSWDGKQAVRAQFGRAAAGYTVSAVHVGGPDLDAMVAAGLEASQAPACVLDVGTGAGHTAFAFARHAGRVDALDITREMLDEVERGARQRNLSNVHCRLGDAEALPFPDDHFDLVTSRLCAHHFQNPGAFARESARVLRPGGTLLLVDSFAPEDPGQDTFFNTFELLRDASHVRNHSRSQWHAMFLAAGLTSEALGSWMLYQDFEGWVKRLETPATAVGQLRFMFEHAHGDLRRTFEIVAAGAEPSVSIPCGLIRARAPEC